MPYNSKTIGRVIRNLREDGRLSQEVLSGFAGIARTHLSMIENGSKNASVETLWRIAEALGMQLSDLIRLAEKEIDES